MKKTMAYNPVYLSHADKKVAGVFGGLGEAFGIDATLLRLGWILVTIFTGFIPGIIGYLVAWMVIPEKPKLETKPSARRARAQPPPDEPIA